MKTKTRYKYKDLQRALKMKKKRLFNRVYSMLEKGNVKFLTFTFKESFLKATTPKTRERYIKAYLNDFASDYVLNIDYGKTTKREHYHAIATPKYKIFMLDIFSKQYGFLQCESIGNLKRYANINKSLEDIAKRLTNHATKDTTNKGRIIYSRALIKNKELKPIYTAKIDGLMRDKQREKIIQEQLKEKRDFLKALGVENYEENDLIFKCTN